ncbi:MAG: peptide ABC transporter substrate-binding protein [Alphaproteobacteria bacterium]
MRRRTPLGRMLRPVFSAALLWLATLASGHSAAAAPSETLTIGITQFPSTLNPLIDAMVAKSYVLAMTRRPIMAYDKDWKLVCFLCTSIPSFENGGAVEERLPNGKKGVALRVSLHPDAKWGDGKPITAADVVFTWEVGRHPQTGVGDFESFRRILKIDVIDDKTFVMHIDRVTFQYNDLAGFEILPAHLERAAFSDPLQYKTKTLFDTDPTNPGLGAGPYRIAEVKRGSHIALEPNPRWWGKPPFFKRIVVRTIENTAALEANLLSGGIDYIAGELGLTMDQALAFEQRQGTRYRIIYKPGLSYEHIDLNLDNPVLRDRRLRQALLYALDREALTQQLFAGRQPVANSFVSPLDRIADEKVPRYAHDPARAATLLDEAGWKKGSDGMRRNASGTVLQFELMTTAGNRTRELVEQVLQSQWRAAGVEIRIRNEPARVFFGETVRQRKFPAMALFAWVSAPESVPRTTLQSASIPTAENNYAGQNYTGFRNPEVDALIDKIELELDRAARQKLWARLQTIYAEELPALPLFFRADPFILPLWLQGVEPTGHQYPTTLWVEDWRRSP